MRKILFLCIIVLCAFTTYAQHIVSVAIKKNKDKTPLAGATATIVLLNKTTVADSVGIATFANIAAGTYQIKISYVGLEEQEVTVQVPQADSAMAEVLLEEGEEHEEEVIITTTRIKSSFLFGAGWYFHVVHSTISIYRNIAKCPAVCVYIRQGIFIRLPVGGVRLPVCFSMA